jgi:tetratricopeptide (TPR) repeat protein
MEKSDQEIKRMLSEIKAYISKYNQTIDSCVPQEVIDNFKEKWKILTKYRDDAKDPFLNNDWTDSRYGYALFLYAIAYYRLENLKQKNVKTIEKLILNFEKDKNVKDYFSRKAALFDQLGRCWHKVGRDDYAIKYFKKNIYYSLHIFNKGYGTTAYAFRKCSNFVYQSLINEQLNVSSPSTFNDPYDCPVIELLNNEDEIDQLIRKAYLESIKIACFVRNVKLPYQKGDKIEDVEFDEPKRKDDKAEYLNSLMWAHYADSHKGICIKYKFPNDLSVLVSQNNGKLSFFHDVEYDSKKLGGYSTQGGITYVDAFFLKVKDWEYENELRFLHFDLEDTNLHKSIDIPNCVEAIYFGLKCPKVERDTIMKIMENKTLIKKGIDGEKRKEESVKFYQMKVDANCVGSLVAEEITLNSI